MQIARQKFNKEERLKSKKQIDQLFKGGEIIHHYPFKMLYKSSVETDFSYSAQIAISVSKRNFKKAVSRNYIKRKIREAYRKNKFALYDNLATIDQKVYFFVIYTAKTDIPFNEIEKSMQLLLQKMFKEIKAKNNMNRK